MLLAHRGIYAQSEEKKESQGRRALLVTRQVRNGRSNVALPSASSTLHTDLSRPLTCRSLPQPFPRPSPSSVSLVSVDFLSWLATTSMLPPSVETQP